MFMIDMFVEKVYENGVRSTFIVLSANKDDDHWSMWSYYITINRMLQCVIECNIIFCYFYGVFYNLKKKLFLFTLKI